MNEYGSTTTEREREREREREKVRERYARECMFEWLCAFLCDMSHVTLLTKTVIEEFPYPRSIQLTPMKEFVECCRGRKYGERQVQLTLSLYPVSS